MTRSQPLPEDLADRPFDRAALLARRRSKGRATRQDLVHPFHGVHAAAAPVGLVELCRAYAVRMRPGRSFAHATAARLHGLPLPHRLQGNAPLHVAVVRPASPPRTRGVVGHRLSVAPVLQAVGELPVCAPTEAWAQLAADLALDELIEIADHLLTVSPLDPAATRRLMRRRVSAVRRKGGASLVAALEAARCPVLSPGETRLEYEGAGHAEARQMRIDVERYERFRDADWTIVRATSDDLVGARAEALVARMTRYLQR